MERKNLLFCGDIHGEFRTLVWKLTQQLRIRNADVIILGDIGMGFCKPEYYRQTFKKLFPALEKNNLVLHLLAGNHDNREYWNSPDNCGLGGDKGRNIKFLQDHTPIEIQGKTIYPIHGATSTDDEWRKKYNKKMETYGSGKRSWWENEDIVKKTKDLPARVDIIVSHCAPLGFSPVTTRFEGETEETYHRDLENRRYLDYVFQNVRCENWYYGHYHTSITGCLEGVIYKCLEPLEIYQKYYDL